MKTEIPTIISFILDYVHVLHESKSISNDVYYYAIEHVPSINLLEEMNRLFIKMTLEENLFNKEHYKNLLHAKINDWFDDISTKNAEEFSRAGIIASLIVIVIFRLMDKISLKEIKDFIYGEDLEELMRFNQANPGYNPPV